MNFLAALREEKKLKEMLGIPEYAMRSVRNMWSEALDARGAYLLAPASPRAAPVAKIKLGAPATRM